MEMTYPGSGRSVGGKKRQRWGDLHWNTLTLPMVDRGDMDVEFHATDEQRTNNIKNGSVTEYESPIDGDWIVQKDEDSTQCSFNEEPAPTGHPELWMRSNQTVHRWVFWLIITLQVCGAVAWAFFMKSSYEGQVSGNAFVEFTTSIGWKGYGQGDNVSDLKNVDYTSYYMGLFTAGTTSLTFFIGILVVIWASIVIYKNKARGCFLNPQQYDDLTIVIDQCLAAKVHAWMFAIGSWMAFAGLLLFSMVVGALGFYLAILYRFSDGMVNYISTLGTEVVCEEPETEYAYGFIVNGVNIAIQLGGGGLIICKAYAGNFLLCHAVAKWKNLDHALQVTDNEAREGLQTLKQSASRDQNLSNNGTMQKPNNNNESMNDFTHISAT